MALDEEQQNKTFYCCIFEILAWIFVLIFPQLSQKNSVAVCKTNRNWPKNSTKILKETAAITPVSDISQVSVPRFAILVEFTFKQISFARLEQLQ